MSSPLFPSLSYFLRPSPFPSLRRRGKTDGPEDIVRTASSLRRSRRTRGPSLSITRISSPAFAHAPAAQCQSLTAKRSLAYLNQDHVSSVDRPHTSVLPR
jgi:hypothetical protein